MCHDTATVNLVGLGLDPSQIREYPLHGNQDALWQAVRQGAIFSLRGYGLTGPASIYKQGAHSVVILGLHHDQFVVHDPDHTQSPATRLAVETLMQRDRVPPQATRPPPGTMLRYLSVEELARVTPELFETVNGSLERLGIVRGIGPGLRTNAQMRHEHWARTRLQCWSAFENFVNRLQDFLRRGTDTPPPR
jgi:hypothetical protein